MQSKDSDTPMLKPLTLPQFLDAANIGSADIPRPVHSTAAARLPEIVEEGKLRAFACNIFSNEAICYLFVGRPAYKWPGQGEASWWQCPVVFVLRGLEGIPIKRIFPFDTGAFSTRKFPEYITMFDLSDYLLGSETRQVGRIITAFYSGTDRYLRGESLSRDRINDRILLTARHMKIEALIRLYGERSQAEFDDRARTIELQVPQDIPISRENLIGVVMPDAYRTEKAYERFFKSLGCQVKYYGIYPLSVEMYFGSVYQLVEEILRSVGPM